MPSYKIRIPFPNWFKPYGNKPSVLCDANGGWYILQLGSVNNLSSTFRQRVWRWLPPYETMDYLEPSTAVVHATFAINEPPNPTLWVMGFNDPTDYSFQSIPEFQVPSHLAKSTLAITGDTVKFFGKAQPMPTVAFTNRPPIHAEQQLSMVGRVIERYRINRIVKRYNVSA